MIEYITKNMKGDTMGQEEEISIENIEYLLEKYMAFLIKTVSGFTGRYVSVENDEEFEIALLAFTEAVEKYQPQRGVFLAFAKLVIISRLKNYVEKEKKYEKVVSLDALYKEDKKVSGKFAEVLQEIFGDQAVTYMEGKIEEIQEPDKKQKMDIITGKEIIAEPKAEEAEQEDDDENVESDTEEIDEPENEEDEDDRFSEPEEPDSGEDDIELESEEEEETETPDREIPEPQDQEPEETWEAEEPEGEELEEDED